MNRRSFLQGILAAGVAPWIITTPGILMPVKKIVTFESIHPLFSGEIGTWSNSIFVPGDAIKPWSRLLFEEAKEESFFSKLMAA